MSAAHRRYTRSPLEASDRLCVRCGHVWPIASFAVLRGRWPSSWCRACAVDATRTWRLANAVEINARRRAVYQRGRPPRPGGAIGPSV
jgi:hypothetical protein